MAHPDKAERVPVFDSDGTRGSVSAYAVQQASGHVLISFEGGRRIQAPADILHLREDGSYSVPFSMRELRAGVHTPEGADSGGDQGEIVAVVPVIVEQAQIAKREVETGRVRIEKTVETAQEQVDVPLTRDQVHVERVAAGRYLSEPATAHYRGNTLVIPVMEEVLVVEKRLLLREEIHVTTVREEVRHEETVTLQRDRVSVTRVEPGQPGASAPLQEETP